MSEEPHVPYGTQKGDDTPAGDTPEHSKAEKGARRRPPARHVGNALGGEGEGSSPGGAPRRHADAATTRRRA